MLLSCYMSAMGRPSLACRIISGLAQRQKSRKRSHRPALPSNVRNRSIGMLLLASLLWASTWALSPLLAENAEPFAACALVFTLAALVIAGAAIATKHRDALPASGLPWRTHLVLGTAMFALPLPLLLVTGSHGGSGWVPLLYSTLPLLVAALTAGTWSPAMVLAVGAALALLGQGLSFSPAKLFWTLPTVCVVASQAFALHYAAGHLRGSPTRVLMRTLAAQFALAAAVCTIGSVLADPAPRIAPFSQWSAVPSGALLLLALLGTAVPYALLYRLLSRTTLAPQQIATTQWLQTLISVGEGFAFSRQLPPTLLLIAGALLAACTWSMLRNDHEDAGPAALIRWT